jgi:hypothetical protein
LYIILLPDGQYAVTCYFNIHGRFPAFFATDYNGFGMSLQGAGQTAKIMRWRTAPGNAAVYLSGKQVGSCFENI